MDEFKALIGKVRRDDKTRWIRNGFQIGQYIFPSAIAQFALRYDHSDATSEGGPAIQPMRKPGSPYAFDKPLVTMARSERAHMDGVSSPSRSAPR